MQNSHHKIITAFTLLQIIILCVFGYTPYPDSEGYIKLANDCLTYHEPYPVSIKLTDLAFIWNIGAVNTVALSLKLFHSVVPLLVCYSLMKGATAWMLYKITQQITNTRTANTALLIYVLYPANYGEATSVLSEVPNIFFSLTALYLIICKKKNVMGGGIIAIANWFRPIGLVYIIAVIIYQRKKAVKTMIGYAAMIGIIGWMSYYRTGCFIYQAQTGWMALLQYSVDNTATKSDDALPVITDTHINVTEKDKIWRNRFFAWLKEHPADYIAQMPEKLYKLFVSDNVNMCAFLSHKQHRKYLYSELNMRQLANDFPTYTPVQFLTIINLFFYYILIVLFVTSCLQIRRLPYRQTLVLPFALIILNMLMIMLVGHGEARFHYPFMPYIIIIDAVFISKIITRKTSIQSINQCPHCIE